MKFHAQLIRGFVLLESSGDIAATLHQNAAGRADIHRVKVEAILDLRSVGIAEFFVNRLLGRERLIIAVDSKNGRIVVKGWREATEFTAEEVLRSLEPYCSGFLCTYVDKEGMMQGTDLDWFHRLRAATTLELTAAGGITTMDEVRALLAMDIHVALGMAIYTGRLRLEELAALR